MALLVSKPVDYGLLRMYQIIAENLPLEVEVFKNKAAALEWIKNSDSDKAKAEKSHHLRMHMMKRIDAILSILMDVSTSRVRTQFKQIRENIQKV